MFLANALIEYDGKQKLARTVVKDPSGVEPDTTLPNPLADEFENRFPGWRDNLYQERVIDDSDAAWLSDHDLKFTARHC